MMAVLPLFCQLYSSANEMHLFIQPVSLCLFISDLSLVISFTSLLFKSLKARVSSVFPI